jgi:sorting nexin-1/2
MLNKTAAHPTLQHDGDLKLFLESESFNVDVKHKERKEPGLGESKGMFSGLGISVGGGGKFVEQDEVSRLAKYIDHWLTKIVVPRAPSIS